MGRVAYVEGRYVPHAQARVHVEDRGYQFADAVYEVWAVLDGRLADVEGHLARLERSLGELRIGWTRSRGALMTALRETVRRNGVRDGLVYLQVSRGVAPRDHVFPDPPPTPTVVITAKALDMAALAARAAKGVAVVTLPDQRWGRCDIKSVGLLPNVLAKQAAREAGAYEAWLVDGEGLITEGASTTAWIVDGEGRLRTCDAGANILRGVTRANLMTLAADMQLTVEERPFSVAEAKSAKEAFLTAASAFVTPVATLDGEPIGDGRPGPMTQRLRTLYLERARRQAG